MCVSADICAATNLQGVTVIINKYVGMAQDASGADIDLIVAALKYDLTM